MPISTIKEIKPYKKVNKDGSKSYGITFEDGLFGYYSSSGPLLLEIGKKVEYVATEHEKQDKSGKYFMLDFIPGKENKVSEKKETNFDPLLIFDKKVQASLKSMELTMNLVVEDKLTFDKIKGMFNEVKQFLWDAIDECASE